MESVISQNIWGAYVALNAYKAYFLDDFVVFELIRYVFCLSKPSKRLHTGASSVTSLHPRRILYIF